MSDVAALLFTSVGLLAQIILGSWWERRLKKQHKQLEDWETMRKEHDPLDISLHRRGFAAWEVWLDHVHLRRDEDIAKMRGVIDAYDSLALIMQIVILFSIALGGLVGGLTARRQWEARSHGVAMSVGVATVVVCLSVYFLYWWHKLRIAEEKLPSIRSRYENLKRKYGRLLWQL